MTKAEVAISPMQIDDRDAAVAIWPRARGVCLSESDSRGSIAKFLRWNPGSSLVAKVNGRIVGAVLCGHDGRRGHIYHLGVDASMRSRGVGTALLSRCMRALADSGITVCRASVLTRNVEAQKFWKAVGWSERDHLKLFTGLTREDGGEPDAGGRRRWPHRTLGLIAREEKTRNEDTTVHKKRRSGNARRCEEAASEVVS